MEIQHLPTRPPTTDPRVARASLALVFSGKAGSAPMDSDWTSHDRGKLLATMENEVVGRIGERFLDRWSNFTVPLGEDGVPEEKKLLEAIRREFHAFNDDSKTFQICLVDDEYAKPIDVEYCYIGDIVLCKHRYAVEIGDCSDKGERREWKVRYKPETVRRAFTARISATLTWETRRKPGGTYS